MLKLYSLCKKTFVVAQNYFVIFATRIEKLTISNYFKNFFACIYYSEGREAFEFLA